MELEHALGEFDSFIGMGEVKSAARRALFPFASGGLPNPPGGGEGGSDRGLLFAVSGAAGTGKTRVAAIAHSALYGMGVLSADNIVELQVGDFICPEESTHWFDLLDMARGGTAIVDSISDLILRDEDDIFAAVMGRILRFSSDTCFVFADTAEGIEVLRQNTPPGLLDGRELRLPSLTPRLIAELACRVMETEGAVVDEGAVDVITGIVVDRCFVNGTFAQTVNDTAITDHFGNGRLALGIAHEALFSTQGERSRVSLDDVARAANAVLDLHFYALQRSMLNQ